MVGQSRWRVMAPIGAVLVTAGCAGGSGGPVSNLDARMQEGLAPQAAMHQADVQAIPDGTRITLADDALFSPGSAMLDEQGRFVLASVIQGLLAPRLMSIEMTPSAGSSAYLQEARVQAVRQFFIDYELGPELAAGSEPGTQQAFTITVHVRRRRPG